MGVNQKIHGIDKDAGGQALAVQGGQPGAAIKKPFDWSKWSMRAYLIFIFGLLILPAIVVIASSWGTTKFLTFPPVGFTFDWYVKFFSKKAFVSSLKLSLWLGLISVSISLIVGTMSAIAIDRFNFPGRRMIQMLLISPLIVPQLVLSIAILQFFAMLTIKRGFILLIIGHVVITSPYVTRSILAALSNFDRSIEEAAMNLGASPLTAFVRVTLPNISAGILGASIFAFIISFSNLTMSIFIGGPRSTTLPIRLWSHLEYAYDPVITTIATVILIITIGLLLILARVSSLDKLF